jgi:hypothetical protein
MGVARRDQPVGEDRDPSHHLVHPSAWKKLLVGIDDRRILLSTAEEFCA